jgi:hypothetical protein
MAPGGQSASVLQEPPTWLPMETHTWLRLSQPGPGQWFTHNPSPQLPQRCPRFGQLWKEGMVVVVVVVAEVIVVVVGAVAAGAQSIFGALGITRRLPN